MDWQYWEILGRVLLAFSLGALIGWERERHGKHAGIRTYGAIGLGSCVFGLISHSIDHADPTRIAAQVVTGIGFLGAGVIFNSGKLVVGLTTAAGLWSMAAIGLAVAFGQYAVAILSTIVLFCILYMPEISWWEKVSAKRKRRGQENDF